MRVRLDMVTRKLWSHKQEAMQQGRKQGKVRQGDGRGPEVETGHLPFCTYTGYFFPHQEAITS